MSMSSNQLSSSVDFRTNFTKTGVVLALCCLVAWALLTSSRQHASAAEITVVVPPALESAEGDSKGPTAGEGSNRNQWLIPASYFAALPNTHRLISEFVLRPDADMIGPVEWHFEDVEIRMSTTEVDPGELSNTYADNIGSDDALFYKGPITFTAEGVGPPEGPRDFFEIAYESGPPTPFFYDPSQGNLLIDLISTNASSTPVDVFIDELTTDFSVVVAGPASEAVASEAVPFAPALKLTFRPVPEPSSLVAMSLGAAGAVLLRRRLKGASASKLPIC